MHIVVTIHHYSAGHVLVHNTIFLYYTIHTYYHTQLFTWLLRVQAVIQKTKYVEERCPKLAWEAGKLAGCDTGALFRELLQLLMSLRFVMIGNDKIIYVNYY